jgi:cell division protein FtsB
MKILSVLLVIIVVVLQYTLWIGPGGMTSVWQLKKQLVEQQTENDKLKERNDVLLAEIRDLKQGHSAIEERARNELGMIKKDETFYQIIEK